MSYVKDYPELCTRTLSDNFYWENVSRRHLLELLYDFSHTGGCLDLVKKGIFYGRDVGELLFPKGPKDILTTGDTSLFHGLLGILTESSELSLILEDMINCKEIDQVNLKEELGDILWYIGIICAAHSINLEDLMRMNIEKLQKRYPEKFSQEKALNRNIDQELSHIS